MVFVNHIVPDGEIGKGFYPLPSCGQFSFGGRFSFVSDQLRVRQDSKMKARIFHPRGNRPDIHRTAIFDRKGLVVRREQRRNSMLIEERTEHLRAAFIPGENCQRTARFQKLAGIIGCRLRIAGIRRKLFGRNTHHRARFDGCSARRKGICHIKREIFQPFQHGFEGQIKILFRCRDKRPPSQFPNVICKAFDVIPCPLTATGRLIQKNEGIRRNIIQPGSHRIDYGKIPIRI